MWTQAECRLDDGADDRTLFNACQTTASGNAELWAGMRVFEGFRQLHVDNADACHALDRIDTADGNCHQRC